VGRVQVATLTSGISQYDNVDPGSYEDDYDDGDDDDDDSAVNKGGALNGVGTDCEVWNANGKESEDGVLT
jgi:hypothetical protein